MTLRNLLLQIHRMVGDSGQTKFSNETVLQYLSEEMQVACKLFPVQLEKSGMTINSSGVVTKGYLSSLRPIQVWVDNVRATKVDSQEMRYLLENIDENVGVFHWAMMNGNLQIWPAPLTSSDIKAQGHMYTPDYALDELDHELTPSISAADDDNKLVPGHIGIPLAVVRYRVAQRLMEERGDFDKAQYYLGVGNRREREAVRLWDDQTTTSTGVVKGNDF